MQDEPTPDSVDEDGDDTAGRAAHTTRHRLALEVRGWLKSLFFALILVLVFRAHVAEGYQIKGGSMRPTLSNGDRLFVEKITTHFRPYHGGDIVVFPHPTEGKKLIKRVAAVGGQLVEVRDGHLYVDGELQTEDYVLEEHFGGGDHAPETVPHGCLFVLGDNRASSNDSRNGNVGVVSEEDVVGRAFLRFWPPKRVSVFP